MCVTVIRQQYRPHHFPYQPPSPQPPHLCPISMCTTCSNVAMTCSGVIQSLLPIFKCCKTLNVDEQALKHPKIQAIDEDNDTMATKGGCDVKKKLRKEETGKRDEGC